MCSAEERLAQSFNNNNNNNDTTMNDIDLLLLGKTNNLYIKKTKIKEGEEESKEHYINVMKSGAKKTEENKKPGIKTLIFQQFGVNSNGHGGHQPIKVVDFEVQLTKPKNSKKKWINMFDNCSAVVFCFSLLNYGPDMGTLQKYTKLFKKTMNEEGFLNIPIVLLFLADFPDEKANRVNGTPTVRFTHFKSMLFIIFYKVIYVY